MKNRSMNPELRIITSMPLEELWDEHGIVVTAQRLRGVGRVEIVALLQAGQVRFVVANIGHALRWIPVDECYTFWKTEVKAHLGEPDGAYRLEEFPGHYFYFASQWESDTSEPIVLLSMHH